MLIALLLQQRLDSLLEDPFRYAIVQTVRVSVLMVVTKSSSNIFTILFHFYLDFRRERTLVRDWA